MTSIAWMLASSDALACSCVGGLDAVLPTDGATGVASDAVPFLVFDAPSIAATLRDAASGDEVPTTPLVTTEGEQSVVRLVPNAPLEPFHTYVIDGDAGYGEASFPVTFTTGEGPDDEVPGAVVLRDVREPRSFGDDSECGGDIFLIQTLAGRPEDAFYETEVAWREDFSDPRVVSGAEAQLLGRAGCTETLPELEVGDEVWLRARAVDLSGNVGPWTAPVYVEDVGVEPEEGRGCDTSGGAALALGLVGLLLRGRGTAR